MIPNKRFHPLSKKITLFVGSILLTNIVAAHKCYVCGPNNLDLNINSNETIPSCDRFDPHEDKFIRECSKQSKGCSIQTNGTILTRACERIQVNDCKVANNVKYCYCKTELCNRYNLSDSPRPADDEDADVDTDSDVEGSGRGRDTDRMHPVPTVTSSEPPTSRNVPGRGAAKSLHQIDSLLICVVFYRLGNDITHRLHLH